MNPNYAQPAPPFCLSHAQSFAKVVGIPGPTKADFDATVLVLKWWCVQCKNYDRQWQHVFECDLAIPPPRKLLETFCLSCMEAPLKSEIITDEMHYLDSAGAVSAVSAHSSSSSGSSEDSEGKADGDSGSGSVGTGSRASDSG